LDGEGVGLNLGTLGGLKGYSLGISMSTVKMPPSYGVSFCNKNKRIELVVESGTNKGSNFLQVRRLCPSSVLGYLRSASPALAIPLTIHKNGKI
jgi:hypothetical protein